MPQTSIIPNKIKPMSMTLQRLVNLPAIFAVCLLASCSTPVPKPRPTNLFQFEAGLWRSEQPSQEAFRDLKKQGIASVLNLCSWDTQPWEESLMKELGIQYYHVPLPSYGAPKKSDIERIMVFIEECPKPLEIHCFKGHDRTGETVACRRIRTGWSNQRAQEEADQLGMSTFEMGMRRFIAGFK